MMNNCFLAHSKCSSSGCESGWTSYLDNSHISIHGYIGNNNNELIQSNKKMKEEEEDLSMVSDASSGPAHEYYIPNNTREGATLPKKKGNREIGRTKIQKQPSLLDDTASSPLLDFSNNNFTSINNLASRPSMADFSQGYSTTHFQGTSTYQEHYGFYYPSLTAAGNPQQHDQWYDEKI